MSGEAGTDTRQTERLAPDPAGCARAVELWRRGGLVAFPTETVYGLGADAGNGRAVARIFAAKGRPRFNPLIVHVPDIVAACRLAVFSPVAERLAEAFWPGPMSLVLPRRPGAPVCDLVSAGLDSLALRVPAHDVAHALLEAFGGPVAAPSANPSGRISPTTAAHVLDGLDGRIDAVIDGGACTVGLESSVLAAAEDHVVILRPGAVTAEDIRRVTGLAARIAHAQDGAAPASPGRLASHYAPRAELLIASADPPPLAVHVGFGAVAGEPGLNLSPSGDLTEAAANLFAMLREADARAGLRAGLIAVSPIPETGLGVAINDRLRRAAAPRS